MNIKSVLARKFIIKKSDGSDIDPEAKYFVLRYDAKAKHGHIGREALDAYCRAVYESNCKELIPLADDLVDDVVRIQEEIDSKSEPTEDW